MEAYELEHCVTILLLALGFSPKNIGYHYLRRAVCLSYQDASLLDLITKKLYLEIGKTFQTKATDVERTIRFTIGEWYKEKVPGAQVPIQEMGLFKIPAKFPSNLTLLKSFTAFLQEAHTSPS